MIQVTATGPAARIILAELGRAYAVATLRASVPGGRFPSRIAADLGRTMARGTARWRKAELAARAATLAADLAEADTFRAALESVVTPAPAVTVPDWPISRNTGRPVYAPSMAANRAAAYAAQLVESVLGPVET